MAKAKSHSRISHVLTKLRGAGPAGDACPVLPLAVALAAAEDRMKEVDQPAVEAAIRRQALRRREAVIQAISHVKAKSIEGALVQLLLAFSSIGNLEDNVPAEVLRRDREAVERLAYSAFWALMAALKPGQRVLTNQVLISNGRVDPFITQFVHSDV